MLTQNFCVNGGGDIRISSRQWKSKTVGRHRERFYIAHRRPIRTNIHFTSPRDADMLRQLAIRETTMATSAPARPQSAPTHYAGFWIRFVAALIDGIIVGVAD